MSGGLFGMMYRTAPNQLTTLGLYSERFKIAIGFDQVELVKRCIPGRMIFLPRLIEERLH